MRISSIDIGSNAIRQVIVETDQLGNYKVLKKHREMIRLGTDVFAYGLIKPATVNKLILAFKRMARLQKKFKVDRSLAYATSAFRDARNKKPILAAIYKSSGVRIRVISGVKEAKLIRLAVQKTIGLTPERCLLIDIGGGSVELTELKNNKLGFSKSYKWGMVRMLEEAKAINTTTSLLLENKIQEAKHLMPHGVFNLAIGTGGNIDAMAKLKLLVLKKGPNTFITFEELKQLYKEFITTDASQRQSKFKIKADRADVLGPALFLTLNLMKKYSIPKIKIPGVGLKEGAVLSLL